MKTLLPKPKSFRHEATRGIALVTTLLLMVMLSALAVAFVLAVNTENRIQSTDKGETKAYYGAEAGMEKMISDLNNLYQSKASPSVADIQGLGVAANYPSVSGINYREFAYAVTAAPAPNNTMPNQYSSTVASGPNEGLIASIIPIGLAVTADTSAKEEVRMTRQVEVALIPVFQFGVFSDPDLSFFAGPTMEVTGRVQTNGDLYITPGGTTTFLDKVRTARELVRDTLANGVLASAGHTGPAFIPTSPNGCSGAQPACRQLSLPANDGSWWSGSWPYFGMPTLNPHVGNPAGTANGGWSAVKSAYGPFLFTFVDGVQPLKLPFVGPGVSSIEILRRPLASDNSTTSNSRLYNKAQIRVMLSDDPCELNLAVPCTDAQNIHLTNDPAGQFPTGVQLSVGAVPPTCTAAPPACNQYFAEGRDDQVFPNPAPPPLNVLKDPNWVLPNTDNTQAPNVKPLYSAGTPNKWNLLDGWLRVEYRTAAGTYVPVTREWLALGFARGPSPPATLGSNLVNPRAILILQQQAIRNAAGPVPACGSQDWRLDTGSNNCTQGANSASNFYPINMYDTREGEPRELTGNDGCTVNGIMNVTEIDVANLKQWLQGTFGGSGTSVESATENGYILYFSDHRGMQKNTSGFKRGAYGFEDVINPGSPVGTPNATLDAGEDVEQPGDVGAGALEIVGARNVGLGFGFNVDDVKDGSATHPDSVYTRINQPQGGCHVGRANWVSGARHAVRLIDGAPGAGGATNLPVRPVNNSPDPSNVGGFTLGTDNAAYIKGDYNMNAATCPSCILAIPVAPPYPGNYPHASAAVLADTVTLLSNGWNDMESFTSPGTVNNRPALTTYYRAAIASGKGVNFSQPAYGGGVAPIGGIPGPGDATGGLITNPPGDFGTDGGDHNFLRYLENWGGQDSAYVGSRVTLYFSQYATGTFKCCGTVYSPPARKYIFDLDFLRIQIVPPGTPRFQEIINVGYKQDVNYR